jgi:hypothetical protein
MILTAPKFQIATIFSRRGEIQGFVSTEEQIYVGAKRGREMWEKIGHT